MCPMPVWWGRHKGQNCAGSRGLTDKRRCGRCAGPSVPGGFSRACTRPDSPPRRCLTRRHPLCVSFPAELCSNPDKARPLFSAVSPLAPRSTAEPSERLSGGCVRRDTQPLQVAWWSPGARTGGRQPHGPPPWLRGPGQSWSPFLQPRPSPHLLSPEHSYFFTRSSEEA